MSKIVGFHIYETQEEHDHRIQLENFRYHYRQETESARGEESSCKANCHALVHNYRHFKSERTVKEKYPWWKKGIAKARLTDEQAERLLLVASKDARVLPDGSIVPHKEPQELVSVIVDERGKPVDDRYDPVRIEAALQNIERVFDAGD